MEQAGSEHSGGLGDEQISKLLRLGLSAEDEPAGVRPVERLLERLSQEDGPGWFRETAGSLLDLRPSPEAVLLERRPDITELERLKSRCKEMVNSSGDDHLISLAGYYLAVAAGLKHHKVLLSGMDSSSWYEILDDLEIGFPPPLDELFREAREALAGLAGSA
jgi:hypothetical protein